MPNQNESLVGAQYIAPEILKGCILKIWQLDPANLTPYYDMALAKALAEAGQSIRFISSRYLYEDLEYPKKLCFR